MKYLAFGLFLFLPFFAKADPFVFEVVNNAITSNSINLGAVNTKLCLSPGLTPMNALSDGTTNAICVEEKSPGQEKIHILIPVKIQLTSSESYDVTFSKASMGADFDTISLKNTRDQSVGGGTELLNNTIQMQNQTINAELEVTAIVSGPNAGSSYSNTVDVDIVPSL